mgnify:CR=1 FL=1
MSLSQAFLDELRARTTLSSLIGASIKVEKKGREHKACCPFHNEKTPSFTINDEKGFYHCFGCGAHGDAIRWMTDSKGMSFIDAVRELADAAGLDVPAPSPQAAAREERVTAVADVLGSAARWYAQQLMATPAAKAMLEARGVDAATSQRFGLGLAPSRISVSGCGVDVAALEGAGLLVAVRDGFADRFRGRIIIPIHDHRGRLIGFGGRATSDRQDAKYLNSPDSESFDKGRTLYNLHRAREAARTARRLIIVEGYFDVMALDRVGIAETVAPMGTALTPHQIARAWGVCHAPVLMMDGDEAGRRAAMRAAAVALPRVAPGRSIAFAMLADGTDPDDLAQAGGADAVEEAIAGALSLADFIWNAALGEGDLLTPEGKAGLWARLAALAGTIEDAETQAQYLADWRSRFDAAFPPPPAWARDFDTLPSGSPDLLSAQSEWARGVLTAKAARWLERRVEYWMKHAPDKDVLLRTAFTGGRKVGAGLIDRDALVERLWAQSEITEGVELTDIDKAVARGVERVWDIGPDMVTLGCVGYPMTDFGIGERLIDRFGDRLRFATAKGWLGWDERRWRVLDQDKDGPPPAELQAAVFDTIRAIQDEARMMADSGLRCDENPHGLDRLIPKGKGAELLSTILARFGRTSEGAGKPTAIAKLAQKWLTLPIEDFDRDPFAINVMNGTLKFRRERIDGKWRARVDLVPHSRDDKNTRLAPVEYHPDASCPIYDDFFSWAQPDGDVRRYLRQVMGYTLTGDTGEQKLWFHYGKGGNGKSVFFDTIAHVAGDYAGTIGIETFLDQGIRKRGEQASPDLARLGGVRFLRASEPQRGAKLNEALIKAATGGEPMAVRALHRGFFDLLPVFALHIAGNYRPDIPGTDEGIWRRMKLVPWAQHRAEGERDDHLIDKLKRECDGIFRWIVDGLVDWLENGLTEPLAVIEATAQYRDDSDPLGRFIKDCLEPAAGQRVQSSHMHEVYAAWCKAAGEREWTSTGFAKAMMDKGFTKKTSNGVKWLDVRMTKEVRDFVDQDGRVIVREEEDGLLRPPDATGPPFSGGADDDDWVPDF